MYAHRLKRREKNMKIDDWIVYGILDRQKRLKKIEQPQYDVNIAKSDFLANVIVFIVLVACIGYLLME